MTVQEFFDQLPSKVDPAKTAGMNNSYVFDITGVGAWTVSQSGFERVENDGFELSR